MCSVARAEREDVLKYQCPSLEDLEIWRRDVGRKSRVRSRPQSDVAADRPAAKAEKHPRSLPCDR